jgi:hypothetical protein
VRVQRQELWAGKEAIAEYSSKYRRESLEVDPFPWPQCKSVRLPNTKVEGSTWCVWPNCRACVVSRACVRSSCNLTGFTLHVAFHSLNYGDNEEATKYFSNGLI